MICYIFFVLWSIYYIWSNRLLVNRLYSFDSELLRLKAIFLRFISFSVLFLSLSFVNLPSLWGLKGLYFDVNYIPRHYIIIMELFLPIALSIELFKNSKYKRISLLYLATTLLLVFFISSRSESIINSVGVLLILLSWIAWKCQSKVLMLIALLFNYHQSAFVLGFIMMCILLFFEKQITSYLLKNTLRKVLVIASCLFILLFVFSNILAVYVENDANSQWRLIVWLNEFESLSKTWFSGVGFGSAYVTDEIVHQVNNFNMYNGAGGFERGYFLVANHSSFLNMFYRMGIIGGVLFLYLNALLIRIVIKSYHSARLEHKSLLWLSFSIWVYQSIVIMLNPGLEMMQFAISYIISLAMLLSIVYEIGLTRRLEKIVKVISIIKTR